MSEVDMARNCKSTFDEGGVVSHCMGYLGHDGPHGGPSGDWRYWTDEEAEAV